MGKHDATAPHEVLLVVDASTQNALNQAVQFHEAVGVTGLIPTPGRRRQGRLSVEVMDMQAFLVAFGQFHHPGGDGFRQHRPVVAERRPEEPGPKRRKLLAQVLGGPGFPTLAEQERRTQNMDGFERQFADCRFGPTLDPVVKHRRIGVSADR